MIFYRLRHATNDNELDCYVGSTEDLEQRKKLQMSDCNNPNSPRYNLKVYRYIRANGGFSNWTFEMLAQVEGLNKLQNLRMERRFTEEHDATLNMNKAGAYLEAGGHAEYMRRANNTNQVCMRCRTFYRGVSGKSQHQRTQKCQRLTQISQPTTATSNY